MKIFVVLGSLNAFLAVALGAFGAHALKAKLSKEMLEIYQTGVQYHMIHAVGLILIALLADKLGNSTLVNISGWSMMIGIVLFSGSLYVLSLSGIKILGAITPLGGVGFLLAWVLIAVAVMKS
ncbi:DUF423 domain-containing protein [Paenibacillus eucommiae]|uniref:DUF423 domain-containing protein n=1 Tax=Paenibacillus eucommiae TaxID=1355755 RepID=UPI001AEA6455|nr:DUF423 domain-containing protein [Paenibacillus eucommiae]